MKKLDLRSDTITMPSEAMRKAIYMADVGDDVYKEDPSVNKLQDMAATLTNKEDALFVTSGSMGNLLSLMINGGATTEVICAANSHIVQHEIGACSTIASILPITIFTETGILDSNDYEPLIKNYGIYDMARTSILEVENTIGGEPYPIENLKNIKQLAEKRNLKVHMDGARVFNACIAQNIELKEITKYCDTITFCLSKGLGSPMGSMLCGSKDFINEARRYRKLLGSGMRQIGFMAAAGIYALENNIDRLAIDHKRAKDIKTVLDNNENIITYGNTSTNIVFFNEKEKTAKETIEKLNTLGILANEEGSYVRLVTNLNLDNNDMVSLLEKLKTL